MNASQDPAIAPFHIRIQLARLGCKSAAKDFARRLQASKRDIDDFPDDVSIINPWQ